MPAASAELNNNDEHSEAKTSTSSLVTVFVETKASFSTKHSTSSSLRLCKKVLLSSVFHVLNLNSLLVKRQIDNPSPVIYALVIKISSLSKF